MEYRQFDFRSEHPQCIMKTDELIFCKTAQDQCVHPGGHSLWLWPEMPICCWHYQGYVNRIHEADGVAAASQARISEAHSNHAQNGRLKAMGSPVEYRRFDEKDRL